MSNTTPTSALVHTPPEPPAESSFDGEDEIRFSHLRQIGGQRFPPVRQKGAAWLLPFSPRHGNEIAVNSKITTWLETNLTFAVPPGVTLRIAQLYSQGRPGIWLPVLELTEGFAEELQVPFTNHSLFTTTLRPGDLLFRMTLVTDEEFTLY